MMELQWAILPRFAEYVLGMGDGRILLEGGASEREPGLYAFPQSDAENQEDAPGFSFSGTVRFVGHSGMLNLPISDPELTLHGEHGHLHVIDPDDGTRLLFASGRITEPVEGDLTVALLLEEDGSELFFYRYPVGTALAALRITAHHPHHSEYRS